VLLAVLGAACFARNVRYFTDHTEDWQRLSNVLADAAQGGCVLADSPRLYQLFRPDIGQRLCTPALATRVVAPAHHYTRRAAAPDGMRRVSTIPVGFASVEVYEKR
jgi:hypothetical protein